LQANFMLQLSLGKPEPGVGVKLSDGDEGEIMIKSSFIFYG
jgi:long-subunit acyl-CoA synthetase (AMP-forming)